MLRFRTASLSVEDSSAAGLSLEQVRHWVEKALAPSNFFLGKGIALEWEHRPSEELLWEIFQGRLLESAHCFVRRTFESWNIFLIDDGIRSTEPLLSVKLDATAGQLHVVRAIHCYAWEGYNAGDNVYLSRETRRWVRELIGTIHLTHFKNEADLGDEIICQLFHAVVGTSRLPLTSIEAPLPAFSLGQLAYFFLPSPPVLRGRGVGSEGELIDRMLIAELSWLEKAKLLETLLHITPVESLATISDSFVERWISLGNDRAEIPALVRTLFNEVSLSPYTGLGEKTVAFLRCLEASGHLATETIVDLLGHLLRQTGRHLTAYDLVTFHHNGANYPDALLLDVLLKAYLELIEQHPALFLDEVHDSEPVRKTKRLRRRALRQGWLQRRRYEGHRVPDAPTSQGENLRVLPAPHLRVPEEQIQYPHRRNRQLFADDPLTAHLKEQSAAVLRLSIHDLHHPQELRELGLALFLDRPLGAAKGPVEPDQTLLLSYEAFSLTLAERRLDLLAEMAADAAEYATFRQHLRTGLTIKGIPVEAVESISRPGTVSLADALRAAPDFVLLRTTTRATTDFLTQYDFRPLAERCSLDWLSPKHPVLIVGSVSRQEPREILLHIYDAEHRLRMELAVDTEAGYASRAGVEFPVNGLQVRRVLAEDGSTIPVGAGLPPRRLDALRK